MNIFKQYNRCKEKFIDDLFYGKDEDLFVRHARRRKIREIYGNPHLVAWIPGMFFYLTTREDLRDSNLTRKEKAILIAGNFGLELILDVARVGAAYGVYKVIQYTNNISSFQ